MAAAARLDARRPATQRHPMAAASASKWSRWTPSSDAGYPRKLLEPRSEHGNVQIEGSQRQCRLGQVRRRAAQRRHARQAGHGGCQRAARIRRGGAPGAAPSGDALAGRAVPVGAARQRRVPARHHRRRPGCGGEGRPGRHLDQRPAADPGAHRGPEAACRWRRRGRSQVERGRHAHQQTLLRPRHGGAACALECRALCLRLAQGHRHRLR